MIAVREVVKQTRIALTAIQKLALIAKGIAKGKKTEVERKGREEDLRIINSQP